MEDKDKLDKCLICGKPVRGADYRRGVDTPYHVKCARRVLLATRVEVEAEAREFFKSDTAPLQRVVLDKG